MKIKMHAITKSCFLLLWMHTLTFVKSQERPGDCTLQDFKNSPQYDGNFDITTLEASYPGGRQVRVGCNLGYSGFFKLSCVEGKWQFKGSKCEPRSCGHPGDAQFADFHLTRGDDFVFGSQVEYTCHRGFQMVSRTNYRRCMAEGWDGVVPVCEAQQCPSIHVPSNVKVTGDAEEAAYGNVVRFSCKSSNLILNGPNEVFCNEYGEWSDRVNVTCEVVKCIKPSVENAVVHGNAKYNENEVLSYTCNPGYKRGQERDSRCTNSGGKAAWIPTPACEAIKCELTLPPVPGTTYEPAHRNRFSPGQKVRVTCGDRYWISDGRSRLAETTCEENGQWTVAPVCQEVTCSRPRDRYFSYWHGWQQMKLGDTVSYGCKTGYRSTDRATRATCTRDGWEPNPLCQEIKCKKESYNNADIIGEIHSEYRYNDHVQYKCKRGYEGRFTRTCGENGWRGSNQCTATSQCQSVSSENRFDVWPSGNKLYYTCKDGYKPLTKGWWGEATCEGGVWSGLEDCIAEQECGEPPVIPKGRLQWKRSQKSISITCKEGYSAEIEELTCNEGQWYLAGRSLDEICRPNDDNCSPPLKVENAVVTTPYQKEYPSGSTVTYQCRAKYTMEGEATIECTAGKWDALKIKCILTCDKLKDEWQTMNFTVYKEKYKNGEIIKYQCKNKERSNGTATCQDGKWTKTIECEEKCTVPEIPSSLRFTTDSPRSQILKGQYLTFTCVDSTHIIKGNATFECLANGQWSDPLPTCEAATVCRTAPNFSNGQAKGREKNQYSHNEKVEYVCHRGYIMEGGSSKTCINGEWIGEMRCRRAQGCTRPPLLSDGGTKTTTRSQYQHGDKIEYVCQAYYIMEGGPFKTCFNGEWTGEIRCLQNAAIKCELTLPPVPGTTYEPAHRNRFSPGQKVRVTCGDRYWISDGRSRLAETTCEENGQWTVAPVCQEVTCSRPRDRYFSYWHGWQQMKLGDTVSYGCKTGYRSTDRATRATCTRDGWEPNPLCQEIKCKKESYNNADIIGEIHSEYRYNDRVQYKCKRGYEGRFTRTCGENGWRGSNQCTATSQCQSVSSENRFDVWPSGNKLYYTCKDGYKPLTKGWWGEATCEGGVWSGLEDCIAEQECGEPPVIPKGRLEWKRSQKSISITCKEGYSAEIEELTCNEGQWYLAGRSLDEICRPNDDNCSPPLKVENAVVTTPYQKEYPSGSTVTYQCRAKYTMEGEATIECTAGKWDALKIKCILTCDKLKDEWQTMNFTVYKEKYKNGEIIKYQCKNKERSNGTATCQDGKWTKTIECEEKCTVPEIPSSLRFTTDSPRSQILKGQYLTFTCVDSTHIIKGNATFECLANGQWSDPLPTCEAATVCRTAPNFSNGQAKGREKNQYSHNEKVEYVCHRGYIMEGGSSKTCINGEWIGEMRCRRAQGCTRPPPLSDGGPKTTTWSQYQHGDEVEYECQSYYVMEGGPIKTCFNGEWTGEIRCLQPCTVTEEELNSHNIRFKHPRTDNPDKMYSKHNDVIEFVCTRGRRVGAVGMRQNCVYGVMKLPTCQ